MDNVIAPPRPDVVSISTAPRPTPTPVRVQFSEVLAGGARALVRGAQAAVRSLPGAPLMAVAVRGGSSVATSASLTLGGSSAFSAQPSAQLGAAPPEGPGGAALAGVAVAGVGPGAGPAGAVDGGLESSMAQAQEMNLYYLQIQEQVNAQNRTFTALSNVLEVEHNTAKSAIGNIH